MEVRLVLSLAALALGVVAGQPLSVVQKGVHPVLAYFLMTRS
jgi:hypothetical protein